MQKVFGIWYLKYQFSSIWPNTDGDPSKLTLLQCRVGPARRRIDPLQFLVKALMLSFSIVYLVF